MRALKLRHGYDFDEYARASLRRRVQALLQSTARETIGELTARVLRDDTLLPKVIAGLSVPVSEMLRVPAVFRKLRDEVLPLLASYSRITSGKPAARLARKCIRWPSCSKKPASTTAARSTRPTSATQRSRARRKASSRRARALAQAGADHGVPLLEIAPLLNRIAIAGR